MIGNLVYDHKQVIMRTYKLITEDKINPEIATRLGQPQKSLSPKGLPIGAFWISPLGEYDFQSGSKNIPIWISICDIDPPLLISEA